MWPYDDRIDRELDAAVAEGVETALAAVRHRIAQDREELDAASEVLAGCMQRELATAH